MTGYQARWDNSPPEAGMLRMFARALEPIGQKPSVSRSDPSDASAAGCVLRSNGDNGTDSGHSSSGEPSASADPQPMCDSPLNPRNEMPPCSEAAGPAHRTSVPPVARIEPELGKPEDWSDLIALAGDGCDNGHGDPLRTANHSPVREDDGRGGSTLFWTTDVGAADTLESNVSELDPLAALTLEYRQALLSQKSGNTHALKTATADNSNPVITIRHDPFAELTPPSHTESSVVDLLTHGRNIDTLLDSLDAFGAGQIFEADEPHEILTLLAPRGLSPRRASQAAQLAREEHHMVSIDSSMSMPHSIESEEPESPDEHDR
ncbi:TagK domain-containing protein [Paraburkholderia sp.]|uniref:TagK domain-containing protein n=1 Tax=Paraburkholderia sp. TaxID=1926495 RepID=UPI0039E36546